jgi:Ino eighty subunit 2
MDTINRLLKKQEPKRRKKGINGLDPLDEEGSEEPKAPATFVRQVRTIDGVQLMVPEQWLDAPAGEMLKQSIRAPRPSIRFTGRMVEEVN